MAFDVSDPNEWERQWNVIWSAPFVVLPVMVIAGLAGWWLQGTKSAGKISVLEERLKFAADKSEIASQAEDELKKQIQTLETAIAAKADNDSLIKLAAEVKEGFAKLETANNAVSSTVSVSTVVLRVTDAQDTARMTIKN
jgi:hypothetical protein